MSTHDPVLEARDLSVYYRSGALFSRKRYCVEGFTCHIHRDEIVGLAGPSGSGKTSVGKALVGLIDTWEGDVYWNGSNIRRNISRLQRRSFGWIGQESTLAFNPSRRIIEVLRETLAVNELDNDGDRCIAEMCGHMHLDPRMLYRYPFEMSGGQVQRCALMRVLMLNPDFLLLDEPTSSLDTINQLDILNLLLSWKASHGLTMLFISHSNMLLDRICHRTITLDSTNE